MAPVIVEKKAPLKYMVTLNEEIKKYLFYLLGELTRLSNNALMGFDKNGKRSERESVASVATNKFASDVFKHCILQKDHSKLVAT